MWVWLLWDDPEAGQGRWDGLGSSVESRPVRGLLRGVRRSAEFCELGSEALWDRNRGGAVSDGVL